MRKAFGDYRRLAGGARTRGSLWEGPDHLLYIETQGVMMEFSESYRRIDYAKLQAFSYGRTRTWGWTLAWQFVMTALCIWGVAASWKYRGDWSNAPGFAVLLWVCGFLLLPLLPALLMNLIKGPTCVCKLQTAVQVLKLKPIKRVREAKRLGLRIAALCQQHQGSAGVVMEPQASPAPVLSSAPESARPYSPSVKVPFTGSALIRWGLVLLLISGGLTIGEMFVDNLVFFTADVVMITTTEMLLVVALIRHSSVQLPGGLHGALWGVVGNLVLSFALGFGLYIYGAIEIGRTMVKHGARPSLGDDQTMELFRWMSHAGFNELGWAAWLVVLVGALNVFFALLGLPTALRISSANSAATRTPPPMPVAPGVADAMVPEAPLIPMDPPLPPES